MEAEHQEVVQDRCTRTGNEDNTRTESGANSNTVFINNTRTQSRQGMVTLRILIERYKRSRRDCRSGAVCLLKAGTWKCCRKFKHIVLVCMREDKERDGQLRTMPSIHDDSVIDANGSIDHEGEICGQLESVPKFIIHHWKKEEYQREYQSERGQKILYNYETLTLAFYFRSGKEFSILLEQIELVNSA